MRVCSNLELNDASFAHEDEVGGTLGGAFWSIRGNLLTSAEELAGLVEEMSSASAKLSTISHELLGRAEDTAERAGIVSAAGIAKNVEEVADAARSTTKGAGETQKAAQSLSEMADRLRLLASKVKH